MDGDDPPVAFDGGGSWTRKRILYRSNDRLGHEPGVEYTRFDPGRTAPTGLVASVDPTWLLGDRRRCRTSEPQADLSPFHAFRYVPSASPIQSG